MRGRLLLVAAVTAGAGCGDSPTQPENSSPTTVTSIAVAGNARFIAGQVHQFVAQATLANGGTASLTSGPVWQSSDSRVATVSPDGVVTSISPGDARITAAFQSKSGSLDITVVPFTGQISECGAFEGAGPFVVTADIISPSKGCLVFAGNVAAQLDCQGHNVSSMTLSAVQGFIVRNCVMRAGLVRTFEIINSRQVTVESSEVSGSVSVQGSQQITLRGNTFRWPVLPPNPAGFVSGVLYLTDGQDNRVIDNSIDGGWTGDVGATYQQQGCDDGIIINDEYNVLIDGNRITRVFDAGIEPVSYNAPITATIVNNTISNAGFTGIGAYYVQGWRDSIFSGNTVSNSPSFLHFDTSGATIAGLTRMTLTNSRFTNNTLVNPVPLPPLYGGSMARTMSIDYVAGGRPFDVSGNLVQNNNLGTIGLAPRLRPDAGFIDGGGNVCLPGGSLACGG